MGGQSGNPELIALIRNRIHEKGRITFAEFMEMALYTPEIGYYNTKREKIGWEGDYYTSPILHPVFGKLLGKQIAQIGEILKVEKDFTIIEMGAGTGLLCREILQYMKENFNPLFKKTRYLLLEKSPIMRERQKDLLKDYLSEGKTSWIDSLEEVEKYGGMKGCLLSNELVDAFPVHMIEMRDGSVKEVYIELPPTLTLPLKGGGRGGGGDSFIEVLDEPSTGEIADYLQREDISLDDGYRTEINLNAVRWVKQVGKILNNGFVITIDYGYPASEFYSPRHSKGTLLCYHQHTVNPEPYIRVGEQDITSHVDFTALAIAGKDAGLELTGFTDQINFLFGLGIAEEVEGMSPESGLQKVKGLIRPEGMGKRFKILIQHKGVDQTNLDGLRFKPYFSILPQTKSTPANSVSS